MRYMNSNSVSNQNTIGKSRIEKLYPYLLFLLATAGICVTVFLRNYNLTLFSLVLVVPIILAAIVVLKYREGNNLARPIWMGNIQFLHLLFLSTLVYIAATYFLIISEIRPVIYLLLIALFSGSILLQILVIRTKWSDYIIVFEIMLLSLNLIWGVGIKYPLYFADTDTLGHLNLIEIILQTSHFDSFELFYKHYPLYHIFNAIGTEITGLSLRTSLFLVMGLIWQIGIFFSYLIFKKLSKSTELALIACLLFASSTQIIFYGGYAIARSLAFVFFTAWIFLITDKAQINPKYLFLSLLILGAMIMTHHLNVLFVIPILVLFYLSQKFFYKVDKMRIINPAFIYILVIGSLTYLIWVASDMTNATLPLVFKEMITGEALVRGDFTRGYGIPVIIGIIYYSFVLFLCLVGFKQFINPGNLSLVMKNAGSVAFCGILMLLIYIPGPFDLLRISDVILVYRFPLLVSLFVIFLMAYGMQSLLNIIYHHLRINAASLVFLIVSTITFLSMISIGNANDTNYLPNTSKMSSPYFTESELESFLILNDKADYDMAVYTDYQVLRNEYSLNNLKNKNIIMSGNIDYISRGYLIYRIGELDRKGSLTFSVNGRVNTQYFYNYKPDKANPQQNIEINLQSENKIFNDSGVQIYLIYSGKYMSEIIP